jgi:lipid-A-disaccharide synthase
MKELKQLDKAADFRYWGGDLMKAQSDQLVKHYKDLAYMGFVEILTNIVTIIKNIKFCKRDIIQYKPDALILVDYPGFNMKIAEFAKKAGIKVFYYISPQIWAWKQGRVHKIKKYIDRMFVILPFEKDFYKRFDYNVDFVGHPLLDAITDLSGKFNDADFREKNGLDEKPIVAILPGSRKQEITKMLPVMLTVIENFTDYQFIVAGVNSLPVEYYNNICKDYKVKLIFGNTYQLLTNAKAALVTSGTATLETALFGVPEVVCYKGSPISFMLAKSLVKVKYISLVNLIMDKEVVKELIQQDFNTENLAAELSKILADDIRIKMIHEFSELKKLLGNSGASTKTAKMIVDTLK